jgi:septum formation protein
MLVLASASPRRQELLRNAGIVFHVVPADIREVPFEGESASVFASRMAREKAQSVFRQFPDSFVLGADTVVMVGGTTLGKPKDPQEAANMLRMLSAKTHLVITAVCLCGPSGDPAPGVGNCGVESGFEDLRFETTSVAMCALSEGAILAYVTTGEPMDKAGAYAIQGIASRWVSRIEGDYFNVVGLPVSLVYRMLQEHEAIK